MFNLNFYQLVVSWMPWFLRKPKFIDYLKSLISPLVYLYQTFYNYRNLTKFKLIHNGQVIYLEHCLNAVFNQNLPAYTDSIATGIFIGPGQTTEDRPYIFSKLETSTEENRVWDKTETEASAVTYPPIILYRREEFALANYDFTINVPNSVGDVGEFPNYTQLGLLIQSWANIYLQAGVTYRIINY